MLLWLLQQVLVLHSSSREAYAAGGVATLLVGGVL
jgi:hypothetical protein